MCCTSECGFVVTVRGESWISKIVTTDGDRIPFVRPLRYNQEKQTPERAEKGARGKVCSPRGACLWQELGSAVNSRGYRRRMPGRRAATRMGPSGYTYESLDGVFDGPWVRSSSEALPVLRVVEKPPILGRCRRRWERVGVTAPVHA